jgi:hypothetical protein
MSNTLPPDHLGDGVYAEDLGHAIVLRVNDHRSEPVVELDAYTMDALIRYYERAKALRGG